MNVETLGNGEAQRARHQRARLLDGEVVLVVAALVGDIERVAEPLGGDQRRACAPPFDHGVGGERRAVHEDLDIAEPAARVGQDQAHTVQDGLFGSLRRRQQLASQPPRTLLEDDIRERAADVDGNTQILDHCCSKPLSRDAGATVDRRYLRCNSQASAPMVGP